MEGSDMKKVNRYQQAIAQEWMIDPRHPQQSLIRLRYRSTYADETLDWLAAQIDFAPQQS